MRDKSSLTFQPSCANTKIFDLHWRCPSVIIDSNGDNHMSNTAQYIEQLEAVITTKLLPVYSKYYALFGEPEPKLNLPVQVKPKQVPALLKPKSGVLLVLPRTA